MGYVVIGAWLIQASVGVALLVGWARHARGERVGLVFTHVLLMVAYFVLWSVFIATGAFVWAWIAVAVLLCGIPFGDTIMVHRSRKLRGRANPGMRDYGPAILDVFARRMPIKVTFHALFSAVVFFGSIGVAIAATVAQ